MTALRMTALALAACAALAGCGRVESPVAESAPPTREPLDPRPELPPPEPDRLAQGYNPDTRTLTFYELPDSARWIVSEPGTRFATPAGPEHRFQAWADPDDIQVYYFRPGGKKSVAVTLRQIQECRVQHASNAR
jgi:hypothetical protein